MTDWRADALCAQVGGELFFSETTDTAITRAAKRICGDCPVQAECLNDALTADTNPPGVFGGTSKGERRRIRAAMRKANSMSINNGFPAPSPVVREQSCSRGPCCHPGRQWGGDEKCRRPDCGCHRRPS